MIYAIVGEEKDLTLIVNSLRGDLGRSVHACAPDESAETLSAAALEADFVTMSHDQVKTAIDANPDVSFHPIAVVGGTKKSRDAAADLREWCAPTRDGRTPRLNAQIGMTLDAADDANEAFRTACVIDDHRALYERAKEAMEELCSTAYYAACCENPGMYHATFRAGNAGTRLEELVSIDVLADAIVPDDHAFADVMRQWLVTDADDDDELDD